MTTSNTKADQTVVGTAGNNTINTGSGNDKVTGLGGNDKISTGDGDDYVDGGAGNDEIDGGEGNDRLFGGAGNDEIDGDDGNDYIDGGDGNDELDGGDGNDTILGGAGNDELEGDDGNDYLDGGAGINKLDGDDGNDVLFFRMSDHAGEGVGSKFGYSELDGGDDCDTFVLALTRAEWLRSDVQADVARLVAYLKSGGSCRDFVFTSVNLKLDDIENFVVVVDGLTIDPRDEGVTLRADAITLTEDAPSLAFNLLANDLVPDLVKTVTVTNGARGTVTLTTDFSDPAKPVANAVYTPNGSAYQYLAAGEKATDTFTYTVTDSDGDVSTQTVTVTITGVNDGPTIVSGAFAGAVVEDAAGTLTATGAITFDDVDLTDSHTVAVGQPRVSVSGNPPAGFTGAGGFGTFTATVVENTTDQNAQGKINWSFAANNADVQKLAAGQVATQTYTLTLTDRNGATVTQDVTVTLTGTNDGPTVTAATASGAVTEDAATAVAGNIAFADVDLIDTHTVSNVAQGGGYRGTFTTGIDNAATGDGAGNVKWNFAIDNAAIQDLAKGEVLTQRYTVTIKDNNGATTTQVVTVTITGVNDAPVITSSAAAAAGAVREAGLVAGGNTADAGIATTTGQLTASDVDRGATATWSGSKTGTFGTFAVDPATGKWSYVLDNTRPATQALKAGEVRTEAFLTTVTDEHGATATQLVTVTVTGSNDGPLITSNNAAATGSVTEAGVIDGGNTPAAGTPSATGTLTSSDVDAGATATWSIAGNSTFGGIAIDPATGKWTYTLANDRAATQALKAGETRTETFTATVTDDKGATATQVVTVTITGTNDVPVITSNTAAASGSVTEAGVANGGNTAAAGVVCATGTLSSSDVDAGATATWSIAGNSTFGGIAIDPATGKWTYTLANDRAATQALKAGETRTETFTATVTDDKGATATQAVTVTITGTNDAPVITSNAAAATGAVIEAGVANGGNTPAAGTPSASGTLTSSDVDAGASATWSIAGNSTFGGIAIDPATGKWTYTLANDRAATQALKAGETRTETFTATVADDKGATATQVVTVTITGTNDVPVAAADTGAGLEDAILLGTVAANDSDVDAGAVLTYALDAPVAGLALAADGSYRFDAGDSGYQQLALNEQLVVIAYYTVTDDHGATAQAALTITLTGTNDAPVAVADTGTAIEDLLIGGSVGGNDSDVDHGAQLTYALDHTVAGLTLGANGDYAFDAGDAAYQSLAAGEILVIVADYTVTDEHGATGKATLTITVTGTNDAPVVTSLASDAAGAVREDGTAAGIPSAMGQLASSDVDHGATATWSGSADGSYGTFVVTASGAWTYTLANGRAATQALKAGETVVETFLTTVTDDHGATATQLVTVTITGSNDAPVVTSQVADAAGAVTEAGVVAGTPSATGQLSASDVDRDATATWSGSHDGQFGAFAIDPATGQWTYTLANDRAATQALKTGETRVETFVATVTDEFGATANQVVTIVVTGTNDAPVVTSTAADAAGAVREAGVIAGTPSATGQLASSDVDVDATATWSYAGTGGYGSFAIDPATGKWTYTLDNGAAATQALAEGETRTETFVATVTDEFGATASQVVTITVTGTNDAPVVTSSAAAASGVVTEAGLLAGGNTATAGTPSATGTLTSSDVDTGATATWSIAGNSTFGGIAIDPATGQWTYTLDNGRAATQALAAGQTRTETFTATVTDDKGATATQVVTVTVIGTNDGPAIGTGSFAGGVTQASLGAGPTSATAATVIEAELNNSFATAQVIDRDALRVTGGDTARYNPLVPAVTVVGSVASPADDDVFKITLNAGELITLDIDFAQGFGQNQQFGNGLDSLVYIYDAAGNLLASNDDAGTGSGGTGSNATQDSFLQFRAPATGSYFIVVKDYDGGGQSSYGPYQLQISVDSRPATLTDTGTFGFTDVDATDTHTTTVAANGAGYLGALTAVISDDSTGDGAGTVRWTFNVANAAVQYLAAGETLTQNYTVTVRDNAGAVASQVVTVTITGTNDVPVVGAAQGTGNYVEDAAVATTGAIAFSDLDTSDAHSVSVSPVTANARGSLTATISNASTGDNAGVVTWSYLAADHAFDYLAAGQTAQERFTIAIDDGHGGVAQQLVIVTIIGTNDAPVVTGAVTGAGTEDGVGVTLAALANASDVDQGTVLQVVNIGALPAGISYDAATKRFTLDPAAAAYQALQLGETITISVGYGVSDGTVTVPTQAIWTITGTNDAPVAVADVRALAEDTAITGSVATNDSDVDHGAVLSYALNAPLAGLTFNADGSYRFDAGDAAYQALALDETLVVTASYTVTDEFGAAAVATLTITLTGTNDTPVAVDDVNTAVEDQLAVTGSVAGNDSDVDHGAVLTYALAAPVAGLTLNANGSYSFDPSNTAYQALAKGEQQVVIATYQVTDEHGATATATLTITVTGANDAPTAFVDATGTSEDGAALTGSVAGNDGDVDHGAVLSWALVAPVAGVTLAANGDYAFNPADAAYQSLAQGELKTVIADYAVTDEYGVVAYSAIVIVLTGTNDAPVVTSLATDAAGAVREDGVTAGTPAATGQLASSDVDHAATATWSGSQDGAFGSFAIGANGAWTYTLGNDRTATQALKAGEVKTETFTATVTDDQGATATQLVTITITGANDAPVVTSAAAAATGAVVENGTTAGTPSAAGQLTSSDVDAGATATWTGAANGTYGSFAIGANGTWSYALDNSRTATQRLTAGEVKTETFTATVTDDKGATATQLVTITITGANDAPVVTSTAAAATGSVVEAGNLANGAIVAGTPSVTRTLTASDVDAGAVLAWNGNANGTYGSFAITAGGVWTYTLDNTRAETQALAAGQTRTETFTATVTDDQGATATQVVTVTVSGTNDSPVITSTAAASTGAVTEAGQNDDRSIVAGTPSATGQLTSTDKDAGATASWSTTTTNGAYGTFALNAAGVWTYTLDNTRAATQALNEGQIASETFTVTVTDDKGATATQQVVVVVNGTNDAPVVDDVKLAGGASTIGFIYAGQIVFSLKDTNSDGRVDAINSGTTVTGASYNFASGDIDGDGDIDVIVSSYNGILVHTNRGDLNGDGIPDFTTSTLTVAGMASEDVALADLNGDGRLDIVTAGSQGQIIELINAGDTNNNGLIDNFTTRAISGGTSGYTSFGTTTGDFNGDGKVDIATSYYGAGTVVIRYNQGDTNNDGLLDYRTQTVSTTLNGMGLAAGDVNGDGKIDLMVGGWGGAAQLMLNRGDTNGDGLPDYTAITIFPTMTGREILLQDIDGDGDLDVIAPDYNASGIRIAYNRGDTNGDGLPDFVTTFVATGNNPLGLALGDVDGDGDMDIIVPGYIGGPLLTLLNNGDSNNDGLLEFTAQSISGGQSGYFFDAEVLSSSGGSGAREDGAAVKGAFKGDDVDGDDTGATLTYRILTQPGEGVVTNNSDGTYTFAVGTAFQDLGEGQTRTVTFTYDATDSHGAVAAAKTVTITVAGTNDAPVVTGAVTGSATEDGASVTLNALANASDVDTGATLSVATIGTLPAGVTYNATTKTFTLNPANAAYQSLAAGQQQVVTVTYQVSDGLAAVAASVQWTVTGTNDLPVVAARTASGSEDTTIGGTLTATDVDQNTALTFGQVGSVAGLTINPNGTWTLNAGHPDYQSLGQGQSRVVNATYSVSDGIATVTNTLTITVNGTNDAPVVTGAVTGTAIEDTAGVTLSALANASDADAGTTLSVVGLGTLPAGVTYDAATKSFTLNPADAAYQGLADGQPQVVTVPYGISDGIVTTAASVSWTITGTNDAPIATNLSAAETYTEDQPLNLTDIVVADADTASLSVTLTLSDPAAGALSTGTSGGVTATYNAATGVWSASGATAAVNALLAGVTFVPAANFNGSFTVATSVSDGIAPAVTGAKTFTGIAVNDAPVAVADSAVVNEDAAIVGSVATNDNDVDSAALAYSLNAPVAGLTLNADGSYSFNAAHADYQSLAAGATRVVTANYTATDDKGATATATLTITVTGTNDAPVVTSTAAAASGSVTEAGHNDLGQAIAGTPSVSGTLTASDADAGATRSWSATGTAGTYGTFAVNAAGVWSYTLDNSRAATQGLKEGQTVTETFTARVTDDKGATADQVVTVTISGANDAPTLSGVNSPITFAENIVNAAPQLIDSAVSFGDVDANMAGGKLVVSGLLGEDRVALSTSGGITVSGGTVSYNGTAIGTVSGGVGGTLTVQFNASATVVSTQAVIQSLTYANVSDTPTAQRTLVINAFDGAGGQVAASFGEQTGANNPFASYATQRSVASFADIDGDGDLDMVVGSAQNGLAAFRNNGNGSFTQLTGSANPFASIGTPTLTAAAFADLNGDGRADLVLGSDNQPLRTFFQNANGSFTEVTGTANPFSGINGGYDAAPTFLDYDGDGDKDMVLGDYGGGFRTFRNNGDGTFTALTGTSNPLNGLNVGSTHSKPAGIDFDGDGDIDIVSGSWTQGLVSFRNNGDGTFTKLSAAENPYAGISNVMGSAPSFADLNGDGIGDAVFGSDAGTLRLFTSANGAQVVVNVTAQNDAPTPKNDTVNALIGVTTVVPVLGNDTDPEGGALTVVAVGTAGKGTASVTNGVVSYTPNAGVSGTDSFTYTVTDPSGAQSSATVFVTLDRPPVAVNDSYTINAGATVKLNVTANDTDPDNDAITITGLGTPAHGTVTLNADNTVNYAPTAGYTGADTFTYTIGDGKGGSATGTVNLTVKTPETAVAPTLVVGSNTTLVPTEGSAIKTTLVLKAGDVVTFEWNFTTDDYAPYKDYAFATVNGQTYSLSNTQATGDYGSSGWNTFTFKVPADGTYVFGQGVMNDQDTSVESYLAIDAIRVNGAIVQSFESGLGSTAASGQVVVVTSGKNTHAPVTTINPVHGTFEAFLTSQTTTTASLETFLGLATGSIANAAKSLGKEYQPIVVPVGVKIAATAHPDETYVTISGAPVGSVFNYGTYNAATNTWKVDISDLGGNLTIKTPSDYVGSFTLSVTATSLVAGSNTSATTAAQSQVVTVSAAAVEVYAAATGGAIKGGTLDDILHAGAGVDVFTGGTGNDTFIFEAGKANGDTIVDFDGKGTAAGDKLAFYGFGTAAQGATFVQIDATHWQVNSADGSKHEIITFSNGAPIDPTDITFFP